MKMEDEIDAGVRRRAGDAPKCMNQRLRIFYCTPWVMATDANIRAFCFPDGRAVAARRRAHSRARHCYAHL